MIADGKVIGRVLEEDSRFGPPELRWGWSVTEIVPATPGVTNGDARRAMAKFRAASEQAKGR